MSEKLESAKSKVSKFNDEEEHFSIEQSTYPHISNLQKENKLYTDLFKTIINFNELKEYFFPIWLLDLTFL